MKDELKQVLDGVRNKILLESGILLAKSFDYLLEKIYSVELLFEFVVNAFSFFLCAKYFFNHQTAVNEPLSLCPEVPRQKIQFRIQSRNATMSHFKP